MLQNGLRRPRGGRAATSATVGPQGAGPWACPLGGTLLIPGTYLTICCGNWDMCLTTLLIYKGRTLCVRPLYINKVVRHMSQFPQQMVRYVPGISKVPPRGQAHGPAPWGQRLRTWQPDRPWVFEDRFVAWAPRPQPLAPRG